MSCVVYNMALCILSSLGLSNDLMNFEKEGATKATKEKSERKKKEQKISHPNGGRVIKSVTLFSGFASTSFYKNLMLVLRKNPEKNAVLINVAEKYIPHFDARVFNVPENYESINNIKWRHLFDYRRNSISGLARKHFRAKVLHGLHGDQMLEKLKKEKNVDWHDMPVWYKWGAFVKSQNYSATVWVGKNQGKEQPTQITVTKTRTVTRIFEMKKQHNPDDENWILKPFCSENEEGLIPDERFQENSAEEDDEEGDINQAEDKE